ncbi:MAG: hypothetical protein H6662_06065 [Ardenticatenaceae bacterium]|nr:hypothetical protein [Anaerolineales bacterium]MCB8921131.1 hypothetical protein [Ardenticatenaceae bacterium]MCB8990836.1 hypothetical protein [Ardenticatenaceae bacterium]MCB9004470.1 hypothetical protein [Ardenticatenaceae bacterium]
MNNQSKASRKSSDVKTMIKAVLLLVIIYVAGASWNGEPTLLQQFITKIRSGTGLSLEELNATDEVKQLRDRGLPEEAIYAYVLHAPIYDRAASLYPVTNQSAVQVMIEREDVKEWGLNDAKYSLFAGEPFPTTIANITPVAEGGYSYAKIVFGHFASDVHHEMFTIAAINVYGTYANTARQLNWQPFVSSRRNIQFIIVSEDEMVLLDEIRGMCKIKFCNIPLELLE